LELLRRVEEARGRNREVDDGQLRPLESGVELVEDRAALTAEVGEPREERIEDPPVEPLALGRRDRGPRVLLQLVVSEGASPDSDHGTLENSLLGQVVERRQRLRACEVAGDAEDDESVRDLAHDASSECATERSMSTPSSRSSTDMRSFA